MFEASRDFLSAYWPIVGSIFATLFLVLFARKYWDEVRYIWMTSSLNAPFFGRLTKWVRNPGPADEHEYTDGERNICSAYHHYYAKHLQDKEFFKKCEDYLMKTGESSRSQKGLFIWLVIFLLMIIESGAFGLALAPYALSRSATPNMAVGGAFAIGIVISALALLLSEKAGHQLYGNRMINQLLSYANMRQQGQQGDLRQSDLINISKTYEDNNKPR